MLQIVSLLESARIHTYGFHGPISRSPNRHVYNTKHRRVSPNERYIDGELSVALDELFCAIKRIDAPAVLVILRSATYSNNIQVRRSKQHNYWIATLLICKSSAAVVNLQRKFWKMGGQLVVKKVYWKRIEVLLFWELLYDQFVLLMAAVYMLLG